MDKDKSHHVTGSSLPPSGKHSIYSPSGSSSTFKPPELTGSSNLPPFVAGNSPDSGTFSHDISRMPDNPPKNLGHRRAHSEILTLPDDISFDSDLGVVGGLDGPSFSDETEEDLLSMYLNMDKFNSNQMGESSNSTAVVTAGGENNNNNNSGLGFSVDNKPRIRHQHSQSMDGSTSIDSEMLMSGYEDMSPAECKKAMSATKLAELALIDPKRAKRIWANRQSAARSKERKMRYIGELERKVQNLQTEATSLSAQLTLLQRDANGLTAENSELKLRLQTTEQQVHLQDALNDALKEEIQQLKILTGQALLNGGPMMNFSPSYGSNQPYYPTNNHAMHTLLTAQQLQQLQIQGHKQHQQQQQQQFQHQMQQHPFQQQQQMHDHQMQQQTGDLKMRNPMQKDMGNDASSKE